MVKVSPQDMEQTPMMGVAMIRGWPLVSSSIWWTLHPLQLLCVIYNIDNNRRQRPNASG